MTRASSHNCPAPGCAQRLSWRVFACRPHWFSIPKPLRDRLWRTWNDGDGVTTTEYAEARQACVDYLESRAA